MKKPARRIVWSLLVVMLGSVALLVTEKPLRAQSTSHGIQFAWTETNNGTPAATFNLYCGTAAGAEPTSPTVAGITANPYLWLGGTANVTYFCKLSAVSSLGQESGLSNEATATFPGAPQTPASFTAAPK